VWVRLPLRSLRRGPRNGIARGRELCLASTASGFDSPRFHWVGCGRPRGGGSEQTSGRLGFGSAPRSPVAPHPTRKGPGYGWPGHTANVRAREGVRVRIPPLPPGSQPIPWPSGDGASLTRRRAVVRVHPGCATRCRWFEVQRKLTGLCSGLFLTSTCVSGNGGV
jgi:hypothetical protein